MFKKVEFIFRGSEITGYGQHAKFFWGELKKLVPTENEDVDKCSIVLGTVDDPVFYQNYSGVKIAFNVWESTRYPDPFFKQLLTFDQLWVPSTWQRECAIEQGYPADRVKVIPEGVEGSLYHPDGDHDPICFNFLHVGKWETRKSTIEIIETWIVTFPKEQYPNLRLYLLVDTNFPVDGMKTTEERLIIYGFRDERIVNLPFQTKGDYIVLLQMMDVFVTCARAEGWNLPLIEAMACGIPSICSQYGAQLDFHTYKDLQVKIKEHRKPINVYNMPDCPGTWAEPDYEDLGKVMLYAYQNNKSLKETFGKKAKRFAEKWSWEKAAEIARQELELLSRKKRTKQPITFDYNFIQGPYVHSHGIIKGDEYRVGFTDIDDGKEKFHTVFKGDGWARANTKYFLNWEIAVKKGNDVVFQHKYNAKGKKVFIVFESSSMGDNLCWIPYCEEFRKKHDCKVVVSAFHTNLFKKSYPEIEFVKPGTVVNDIYAQYNIGVYHDDRENKHPRDWRAIPLQRVASDILGLEYKEIRPIVDTSEVYTATVKRPKQYVCISEFSTAQCKHWNNPDGWQQLVDKLVADGYNVVAISKEKTKLKNVIDATNNNIDITIGTLLGCEFFIGLASGLAWLAWALGKKVVMISGFSEPFEEFVSDNIRIAGVGDCVGCLNDIFIPNRAWDEGCFHNRDFSCTKNITADMVYERLPIVSKEKILDFTTAPILRNSRRQTSFKKYLSGVHNFYSALPYGGANLIEIGTVRRLPTDPDLPGDGNSTSIFAWYVKNYAGRLTAVDIAEESIKNCKTNLSSQNLLVPNVTLLCEDGLKFLKVYKETIHGIYIDALDYDDQEGHGKDNSAKFHLEAFRLAEKNFITNSVIMFDDIVGPNYQGKAELVVPYALSTGDYEILYQDYQVILRRK
jgi:autotransporter strand-loop-strand O-heptosyltransferase